MTAAGKTKTPLAAGHGGNRTMSQDTVITPDSQALPDAVALAVSRLRPEDIYTDAAHKFKASGDRLRGGCPWHKSSSGTSFVVSQSSMQWYCAGCSCGGGPVQYLHRLRGGDGKPRGTEFIELGKELCAFAGVDFPEGKPPPEAQARYDFLSQRSALLANIIEFCQTKIRDEHKEYLHQRGFTPDDIAELRIGYYDVAALRKHLAGYDKTFLESCGVLWRELDGYLVFPWNDDRKRPLTLYYKWTAKTPPGGKPKTTALPNPKLDGNPIMESKHVPYCFDRARGEKNVVLVEGVTDAALAQVRGDKRVIACVAAQLSKGQVETLRRHKVESVTICLDPDKAGDNGITSCVKSLEEAGIKPLIAPRLPEDLDPDEFIIQYGIGAWKTHIDSAKTPLQRDIEAIAETKPDLLKLSSLLEPIKPKLAKLPRAELEGYLDLIKMACGVKTDFIKALRREITNAVKCDTGRESPVKAEPTANLPGLVEICQDDSGEPVFLLLNAGGDLEALSSVPNDCGVYVPPPKESMKWLLPHVAEVQRHFRGDSDQALFSDLVDYHKSISEMPSEGHYEMLTAWDIHTYLFDKSDYSPYVWLYAIPERGKTRTGKGCIYVARRGLHVESLRDAYLIRVAQDLNATLFFDVLNIQKKAEQNGTDDILMLRYEKGATVPRVLYPDRGAHRDTVYYSIYGATLIATNEHLGDIFATRAVQVTMPESDRTFDQDVKPETGLELKERLTAFRARHLGNELPEVRKPCRGRMGDILRPLVQAVMLAAPERTESFTVFCKKLEEERHEALADTFEAKLIEAIEALEEQAYDSKLDAGKITETINAGKPERFQKAQNTITRTLKSMGFKAQRSHGATWIEVDSSLLEKLRTRYCTHTPGKSAPSVPTVHFEENQGFSGDISGTERGQKSENVPPNGDTKFSVPKSVPKVHRASPRNDDERTSGTEGAENQRVYAGTDAHTNFVEGDFDEGVL